MSRFKIAKSRLNSTDVLVGATSIASIVTHVSDMLQFLPARAAASIVLVILQTVQQIDNNKVACYKLGRRAAKILVDLKIRMVGRLDTAPKALIENIEEYEKVLRRIRDFMQEPKKVNWMGRLLKKGSIEEALADFHSLLDEAEQSFQIASLVEIHYTVGILEKRSTGSNVNYVEKTVCKASEERTGLPPDCAGVGAATDPVMEEKRSNIASDENPVVVDDVDELQLQEELKDLEQFGFKKYHQTDLRLLTEVKSASPDSFWKDIMVADVGGNRAMVKRYDSARRDRENIKRWLNDIKILRNLYHPNLPQLKGYSDEKSSTPFILLSQAKLRDPNAYLLNALDRMSVSKCTVATLRMYRDISSAALYVQRQLSLDERETQVIVADASYMLDVEDGKIIVGLPSPKQNEYRGFGYPLSESLLEATMKILPWEKNLSKDRSFDTVGLLDKLAHVRALANSLLPKLEQEPQLNDTAESLLEDSDFNFTSDSVRLSQIRKQSIAAGTHEFAWHAGIHSCSVNFTVGDIGYISCKGRRLHLTEKSRFEHFIKVGNLFDSDVPSVEHCVDDSLDPLGILREVTATHGQWINGFRRTEPAWPFSLSGDIEGWPISLTPETEIEVHVRHTARMASISQSWQYLLRKAEAQAVKCGIKPQELILITKTVSGQVYRVRDWSPARPPRFMHSTPFGHGNPHFSRGSSHYILPSRVLYLFTSWHDNFVPFLSEQPSAPLLPSGERPAVRNVGLSTAWGKPEAFIGYIQLSVEDFT